MSISYGLDDEQNAVICTGHHTVTNQDMAEFARRFAADRSIPAGSVVLMDLRDTQQVDVTGEGIRRVVDILREDERNPRLAIVAENDVVFGLSRMYEMLREDSTIEIRVFREIADGREWLGLNEPD